MKILYRCKKCGWSKEVPASWADIKPLFCPNSKCTLSNQKSKGKKSFRTNPEDLETVHPEAKATEKPKRVIKKGTKKVK